MMNRQFVEVQLGGETRLLRFDFNAVADIEEYFGRGIVDIFQEQNIGLRTIRALYWAGLKWKDRGLTIERVGLMLQEYLDGGGDLTALMEPVIKAFQSSGLAGNEGAVGQEEKN